MSDLEILEKIGTDAVLRLRKSKLSTGKPFMINSKNLPSKQSYLEYPDGSIKIVTVAADAHSFEIIRTLSDDEAESIRFSFSLL